MKAPVISLHGFPGLPSHWDGLAAALPEDRTFWSIPMPWLSGSQPGIAGLFDVVAFVAALSRTVTPGPAHFIGHDLGAVALYWLARSSFPGKIMSMTLISAPHPEVYAAARAGATGSERTRYIDMMLSTRDADGIRDAFLESVRNDAWPHKGERSDAVAQTDFSVLRKIYAEIRNAAPTTDRPPPEPLSSPVALVHFERDPYFSEALIDASIAQFGAGSRLCRLPGEGHDPHLADPTRVAAFCEEFWNAIEI